MKLIKLLTCCIATLFIANILYANKLVGFGQRSIELQEDIIILEKQNHDLSLKVAKESSLTAVSEKINLKGYSAIKGALALTGSGHVAAK